MTEKAGERTRRARQDQADEARRLYAQGWTMQAIADHQGVAKGTVLNDLRARTDAGGMLDRRTIRQLYAEKRFGEIELARREGRIDETATTPVRGSVRQGDPIPGDPGYGGDAA